MLSTLWVHLQLLLYKLNGMFCMVAYGQTENAVTDDIAIQSVVDTGGRATVGGGEVLFFLNGYEEEWTKMNAELIRQLNYLPLVRVMICFTLVIIFMLCIIDIIGLGNGVTYGGLDAEINNINQLRKREAKILRNTKILSEMTLFVDSHGFGVDPTKVSYLEYNLKRAGIKHPNGQRTLSPNEYNAILKFSMILSTLIGLIISLKSATIGISFIILMIVILNIAPELTLRNMVLQKDRIIKNNFFDFYGELHYPMVLGASEPLIKIIRHYNATELVPEMKEFTNNVADLFDIYGEYEGSKYVSMEYKEIPEVTKLMRLIRQYNESADIKQDMIGFREQLLLQQQINIDKHCDALIAKARKSFIIIWIILGQALVSATLIYAQDLGGISSLI